jgi:hypothetical protein
VGTSRDKLRLTPGKMRWLGAFAPSGRGITSRFAERSGPRHMASPPLISAYRLTWGLSASTFLRLNDRRGYATSHTLSAVSEIEPE